MGNPNILPTAIDVGFVRNYADFAMNNGHSDLDRAEAVRWVSGLAIDQGNVSVSDRDLLADVVLATEAALADTGKEGVN